MIDVNKRIVLRNLGWGIMIILALWACFLRFQFLSYRNLDTACMAEIIESVLHTGVAYSKTKTVLVDYLFGGKSKPLWTSDADNICNREFKAPVLEPINQFRRHTYFIIYLLAPLTAIFSGEDVAIFSNTVGFCALVLFLWLVLRSAKVGRLPALVFCAVAISHPAWSMPFAFGEPYPDRLFLPLFMACLYFMVRASRDGLFSFAASWPALPLIVLL